MFIETPKIHLAREIAIYAHRNQKYAEHPYQYHLEIVLSYLRFETSDEEVLTAGWLHDVLEDTNVLPHTLGNVFGWGVSDIVNACSGEGANRLQKQQSIKTKITQLSAEASQKAALVKWADRAANMWFSKNQGDINKFRMYQKELDHFAYIRPRVGEKRWNILQELAKD